MGTRAFSRRRTLRRPVAAFVLLFSLGPLLSACGGSEFSYVSSTDGKAFFKVPHDWHYFDKRELLLASGQSLSSETSDQLNWLIGYDASPVPSLENLARYNIPQHPVVYAQAQVMPFVVREGMSLRTLRNYFYPVDQYIQENRAKIIESEEIALPDGFHGSRTLVEIHPQGIASSTAGAAVLLANQVGLVDVRTEILYFFIIRCEAHCYRDNKSVIDQVVSSWTVRER
jgi:hypothetical protein